MILAREKSRRTSELLLVKLKNRPIARIVGGRDLVTFLLPSGARKTNGRTEKHIIHLLHSPVRLRGRGGAGY